LAVLAAQPEYLLVTLAYTYLASGFIGLAWAKLRKRDEPGHQAASHVGHEEHTDELATKNTKTN
jgi:hypothetical protein